MQTAKWSKPNLTNIISCFIFNDEFYYLKQSTLKKLNREVNYSIFIHGIKQVRKWSYNSLSKHKAALSGINREKAKFAEKGENVTNIRVADLIKYLLEKIEGKKESFFR